MEGRKSKTIAGELNDNMSRPEFKLGAGSCFHFPPVHTTILTLHATVLS